MSELLYLRNKASQVVLKEPVTREQFEIMDKKGQGHKLFTIERTEVPRELKPLQRKQPTVPAEVQRVPAKNVTAALPEAHNSPEQDA